MTPVLAAIDRNDIAVYVDSFFFVLIFLILARIVISYFVMWRGSIPYITPVRAVTGFVEETVDPFLNRLRRVLPSVGAGGMSLDLSPMVALIGLFILQAIVVGIIRG